MFLSGMILDRDRVLGTVDSFPSHRHRCHVPHCCITSSPQLATTMQQCGTWHPSSVTVSFRCTSCVNTVAESSDNDSERRTHACVAPMYGTHEGRRLAPMMDKLVNILIGGTFPLIAGRKYVDSSSRTKTLHPDRSIGPHIWLCELEITTRRHDGHACDCPVAEPAPR